MVAAPAAAGTCLEARSPAFGLPWFSEVEPVLVRDPLSELLGVVPPGQPITVSYADCVRIAGHSCLAVAGGFGIAKRALQRLFPGELPVRGEVEVTALGAADELAFGPIALAIGMVVGAEAEVGFAGLHGKFRRRGLIRFIPERGRPNGFELTRLSAPQQTVVVEYHPERLTAPRPPAGVLGKLLEGAASDAERRSFVDAWQGAVREVLLAPPAGVFVID